MELNNGMQPKQYTRGAHRTCRPARGHLRTDESRDERNTNHEWRRETNDERATSGSLALGAARGGVSKSLPFGCTRVLLDSAVCE
ncbi:unnamed protein product, partial [Iphiclides podalirius]